MSSERASNRLRKPFEAFRMAVDRTFFGLSTRASRLLALVIVTVSALLGVLVVRALTLMFVWPAAAQANGTNGTGNGTVNGTAPQVGNVLCGGMMEQTISTLIAFGLAAISMFLIVKAILQGTAAFNKMGSARAQDQFEGKQELAGAGKTAVGAFVPPLFIALLDTIVQPNIADCLMEGLRGGVIFGMTAVTTLPL